MWKSKLLCRWSLRDCLAAFSSELRREEGWGLLAHSRVHIRSKSLLVVALSHFFSWASNLISKPLM